jgi:DNA-binding NtrC family response regulator
MQKDAKTGCCPIGWTAQTCCCPRLLIADDEEGPRASVRVLLQDRFQILAVDSSEAAIRACREHRFDVVVSDTRRAGMSGLDCFEEIRKIDRRVPVVFVSAYVTQEKVRRAIALDAFGFLDKPFDIHELCEAVCSALIWNWSGLSLPPLHQRPFQNRWRKEPWFQALL